MKTTNLQKTVENSKSFNGKDFQTARQLASQLKFQDFEINESNTPGANWFGLFLAENNAYWSIVRSKNGKYNLECDGIKVCLIDENLEKELEIQRENILEEPSRKIHSQIEFHAFQNELWFNYGHGKI